jgi:hypothetical protein
MPSNKLSVRRDAANKPSICFTKRGPIIYYTTKTDVTIRIWSTTPYPYPTDLFQTVTVEQTAPGATVYYWQTLTPTPNHLWSVTLHAPERPLFNYLELYAMDETGLLHPAANTFEPSRPLPIQQQFNLVSGDWLFARELWAKITPITYP